MLCESIDAGRCEQRRVVPCANLPFRVSLQVVNHLPSMRNSVLPQLGTVRMRLLILLGIASLCSCPMSSAQPKDRLIVTSCGNPVLPLTAQCRSGRSLHREVAACIQGTFLLFAPRHAPVETEFARSPRPPCGTSGHSSGERRVGRVRQDLASWRNP